MTLKRVLCLTIACVITLASATGCASAPDSPGNVDSDPQSEISGQQSAGLSAENLMAGIKSENADSTLTDAFINGAVSFSLDLFNTAVDKEENELVSPLSVLMALGLAANGAVGDTKAAFDRLFGTDDPNPGFSSLLETFSKSRENVTVSLANSIWFSDDFLVNDSFLQMNANYFNAGAFRRNLQSPGAPAEINEWISANTQRRINNMLDNVSGDAVMLLANAIYFNAAWEQEFPAAHTGIFRGAGGDTEVEMMNLTADFGYSKGDGYSAVLIPYEGGDFAFMALLPDGGLAGFELNEEAFRSILAANANKMKCTVTMPKFEIDSKLDLTEILSEMGLRAAFDANNADFSLMGSAGGDLFIGEVAHSAYIKVEENGTEAAAAAITAIYATGLDANPPPAIILDRPFIFGIVDVNSGLPLFLGTVTTP